MEEDKIQLPTAYVTGWIPEKAMELLQQSCRVIQAGPNADRESICRGIAGADAVLCGLNDRVDGEMLDAAGARCQIFANYGVGFNHIDVSAATQRNIWVSNTPDVLTDATADVTMALMLAAARRVTEGDRLVRSGSFGPWGDPSMFGLEVSGKTLGIIGAGRIGQAVARRAAGFSMKLLYYSRRPSAELEQKTGASHVGLEELLTVSDFVSVHVPLTEETRHLIGERELRMMKKTGILINTSRGPVVDENMLVKALQEKWIWAAGLDVYEKEPELAPGLAQLDNAVLTPHIGSATMETRTKMGLKAVENLLAALQGQVPPDCLNPEMKKRKER